MPLRSQRGMTILEVVIATAIFGLVVTVLTGFFLVASSRGLLGRNITAAALLAQQRIELLKSKGYSSLSGFAATEQLDSLGNATPSGLYTRVTTITSPVLGTPLLTEVDVTVTWMDQAIPRTLTLSTLVASY
ncbi:MAG TPA: type II secretion system protein [bacterium]|nr:type II secretion system protein [bacterium]